MKKALIFLVLLLVLLSSTSEALAISEDNIAELKIYFYDQEDYLIEVSYLIKNKKASRRTGKRRFI